MCVFRLMFSICSNIWYCARLPLARLFHVEFPYLLYYMKFYKVLMLRAVTAFIPNICICLVRFFMISLGFYFILYYTKSGLDVVHTLGEF